MEKILIDNYRNFSKEIFHIGDITFFVGENGIGKTSIINLIKYIKTFKKVKSNNSYLRNKNKKFWILHTWEDENFHKIEKCDLLFEFFEISFNKKTECSYISKYSTFRGEDVIIFDIENNTWKYSILKNKKLSKLKDLKTIFKEIKKEYKNVKQKVKLFDFKNNGEIIFNFEDYSIEKIFNTFANVSSLRSKKDIGESIYNEIINEKNIHTLLHKKINKSRRIHEQLHKETKNENLEKEFEEINEKIELLLDLNRKNKIQIERVYYNKNFKIIKGTRPLKINDLEYSKWINSYYKNLDNNEILNIINDYLKESKFEFKLKVKNYEKIAKKYNYLSLYDDNNDFNINECGDGIIKIIPILLQIFEDENILAIQEPELHLHPRSIAELGSLIYKKLNKEIILETHSNHLIERIRFENCDSKEKKQIFLNTMFYKNKVKKNAVSKVKDDGRFNNYAKEYLEFHEDETLKWFR